jgi:hypothetical protein
VFRTFNGGKKLTANRIAPIDVARLVKRLTLAAGIEGDFAAHSLRAGFIASAAATKGLDLMPRFPNSCALIGFPNQ